jgi:hypothetical protein
VVPAGVGQSSAYYQNTIKCRRKTAQSVHTEQIYRKEVLADTVLVHAETFQGQSGLEGWRGGGERLRLPRATPTFIHIMPMHSYYM